MAGRDYKVFVESVFRPLTEAAGRPDLLASLKTADVATTRRAEQFAKFKSLNLDKSQLVYLPNGGFSAQFQSGDRSLIAISSAGMNLQDEQLLQDWATGAGLISTELDESLFIFLAHELRGYYRIRDQFRASRDALNAIDIIDERYQGHEFEDLYQLYRPVFIYEIESNSPLFEKDIFTLSSEICIYNPSLRSQIIDQEVSSIISEISKFDSVDRANLFQALTSAHWRYVFLEFFRIIESIFFLPWVLDLKSSGDLKMRAWDLKASCRTSLQWRESHRPSMERLFGMVRGDAELDKLEDKIRCFRDLKNSGSFHRSQIGSRIYTVRNGLVHHEDFEDPAKYVLDDEQWRWLCLYLATAIDRLYQDHHRDLTPSK